MNQDNNYFLKQRIAIDEKLLTQICNWAFNHTEQIIKPSQIQSHLFKIESKNSRNHLISFHLLDA